MLVCSEPCISDALTNLISDSLIVSNLSPYPSFVSCADQSLLQLLLVYERSHVSLKECRWVGTAMSRMHVNKILCSQEQQQQQDWKSSMYTNSRTTRPTRLDTHCHTYDGSFRFTHPCLAPFVLWSRLYFLFFELVCFFICLFVCLLFSSVRTCGVSLLLTVTDAGKGRACRCGWSRT